MPLGTLDSETAAMFKSLLLRSLAVELNDKPEDVRFNDAFRPLCEIAGRSIEPNHAFTTAWLAHVRAQQPLATEAARRFLDRYEYKSLWETQEIQEELNEMWELSQLENDKYAMEEENTSHGDVPEPFEDPDRGKPRVTVRQYTALIGQEVMANLEGLARARKEKHPRAYQTDAEIHQAFISATSSETVFHRPMIHAKSFTHRVYGG